VDLSYSNTNLFPSIIHQFDVNGFSEIKDKLIDYVYDCKKNDSEGRGEWQSITFSFNDKDKKDILQSFLTNCLSEFPPIKKSVNLSMRAWVNISKPGGYLAKHHHPDCNLAGVLWIKALQNSGNIVFHNPRTFDPFLQSAKKREIDSYTDDFKNKFNIYSDYDFPPTEGRILIFPSYLEHQVRENKSNKDRISVSFNIKLS
jgi:hypothetical protein